MKVKLDENLGALAITMFSDAQHDVATVPGQRLSGHSDQAIYDVCRAEDRLLVTLDLDFANPFRFDPGPTAGIAVIRVPTLPGLDDLRVGVSVLIRAQRGGRRRAPVDRRTPPRPSLRAWRLTHGWDRALNFGASPTLVSCGDGGAWPHAMRRTP